jgi:hypothetical protein
MDNGNQSGSGTKPKTGKKRKNKTKKLSGEKDPKIQVKEQTTSQAQSNNESAMSNPNTTNSSNNAAKSPGTTGANTMSPVFYTPQSHSVNAFSLPNMCGIPGPQGPMAQFVGNYSPPHFDFNSKLELLNTATQLLGNTSSPNQDLNAKLDMLNKKIDNVVEKMDKLDIIESRLTNMEVSVITMKNDMKEVKNQITEMDIGLSFLNTKYEENKMDMKEMNDKMGRMMDMTDSLYEDNERLKKDYKELQDKQIEMQSRSMRDNLIFTGIDETEHEDTEMTLKRFLEDEMNISDDIGFHRVHRLGRGQKRPIVAKFVLHKEKEKVRKLAPEKLRNKPYGINEQYPKEINDRRKALYPHYKAAKSQGKKAVLNMDKLYIEGVLFNENGPTERRSAETDQGRHKKRQSRGQGNQKNSGTTAEHGQAMQK